MYHHHTINKSRHYPKNYLYLHRHFGEIRQDLMSLLMNQQIAVNSWNNPVNALQSLGLIEFGHPTPPLFAELPPKTTQPDQQKVLSETSEWDKYINWDPEEPSTSSSKEIPQISTESNDTRESVDFRIENQTNIYQTISQNSPENPQSVYQTIPNNSSENQLNSYQTIPADPYKFIKKSPQSELKCQYRLNKIYKLTSSFTRKAYLQIFHVSNSRASDDFEYALKSGVLTKSRVNREIVYSFIKRDPSWVPFSVEQFIRKHNSSQQ